MAGAQALEIAEACSRPITEAGLEGGLRASLEVLRQAIPASFQTAGPGYLAYIPGGGIVSAGLADLLADTANRFTGITGAAPALTRLEGDVLRWLCREFGYGKGAYGLLTPGGSTANFSAFVAARVDRFSGDGDYRKAIAYTSSQAHHSVHKSLHLTGIPLQNVRSVPVDERLRMRVDDLAEMVKADKAAGMQPFLVVGAAGTTNTGAIDPLHALADLAEREGLWFHIDGAYGASFVLCEEGRRRLDGLARADSITFDPHKGMFLPYGTGCLLVKRADTLRRAHQGEGAYLQDFEEFERRGEVPAPCDMGPELSRDFRGLRLWLPLMLHGAAAFRSALSEKLQLAELIDQRLRELVDEGLPIEVVDAPQLSLSTFRLERRRGEGIEAWNQRNMRWMQAINGRKRAYLSSTSLPAASCTPADDEQVVFTLRACVLSFRTHREHIDHFLEDLAESARELATPGAD
jgi:aromatic-L-amino-acid decarboxylase